jgi:hypothetical protein
MYQENIKECDIRWSGRPKDGTCTVSPSVWEMLIKRCTHNQDPVRRLVIHRSETSLDLCLRFRFHKPLHALWFFPRVHGDWADDSHIRMQFSGKQGVLPTTGNSVKTFWEFFSQMMHTRRVYMSFFFIKFLFACKVVKVIYIHPIFRCVLKVCGLSRIFTLWYAKSICRLTGTGIVREMYGKMADYRLNQVPPRPMAWHERRTSVVTSSRADVHTTPMSSPFDGQKENWRHEQLWPRCGWPVSDAFRHLRIMQFHKTIAF